MSTLEAFFQGRRELSKGLAMEKLETWWREHPVFHFDFNGLNFSKPGTLENALEDFVANTEAEYGKGKLATDTGKRFEAVLKSAKQKTGRGSVVLIDECAKPLLDVMDTAQEETNRDILKAFYSTFKAADKSIKFAFLTGATKVAQAGGFSGFNQPEDLSMNPNYGALCGITEEELHAYFTEALENLARKLKCSAEGAFQKIKRHYAATILAGG